MTAPRDGVPLLAYAGLDDKPVRVKRKPKAKRRAKRKSRPRAPGPARDQDEKKAEKVNRAAIEAAPLLATAGLVEQTTAEVERERRLAAVTAGWWTSQQRNQTEAQTWALIEWLRWQALSLVSQTLGERVDAWVKTLGSAPAYVWRHRWSSVLDRLHRGEDPMPPDEMIWPSACWPALHARRDDFQAACAEHEAAGCTKNWCAITGSRRPAPYASGEPQTWAELPCATP